MTAWSVVVPTIGRPSLADLLADLAAQPNQPARVIVVNDRPAEAPPVANFPGALVVPARGRGPAAARNLGWRRADTDWVVFLDDDVRLPSDWSALLLRHLESAAPRIGGVQARIDVPEPAGRRPTDWERSTAGLRTARWATADMAYRTTALEQVHGFDERFPRAYREDADLARRVRDAGWQLVRGERRIVHPVRPAGFWTSVRVQKGNADDSLLRAIYGPNWRTLTECGPGRLPLHLSTVAAAAGLLTKHRRIAAVLWAAQYAEFATRRILPGPRTAPEIARMLVTSAVIPFVAVGNRIAGWWRHPNSEAWPGPVRAVLFDRDGTLVHDVPYNGDPARVRLVDGAAHAVERLRRAGLRIGVVTNQSGVGRGLLTVGQMTDVNTRVDELLGRLDTWQVCPHAPEDQCQCRKPRGGLIRQAARQLGVPPHQIVVIGDIGADVSAARSAGARAILVPNAQTRAEEIVSAPARALDLAAAVDWVLGAR
ncbi:HAD-IIIA family hydrolase [Kribbella jejuensis]|uniref:D,D-heptose 1,7-bisphosphate phosphatase n=1 Tax=Kribbella jejuensis TaxID=236068 RepID=A0A542EA35_9ACTN|nr:HAD-IIIA family hydrolase [Kribbella jejuensis]TQJ12190.1 histidinol-phosphate phosphatase family protein/HAD superfamily hydrolase (TIGR01662 family) [Kribbella jejuensis]